MQLVNLLILLVFLNINLFASYNNIVPGVWYKNLRATNPAQSIHILIADPLAVNIKIGIASHKCASSQTTTQIAKDHMAIAAINGGFFDFGCKNKFEDIVTKIFDCLGYSKYKAYPVYTLNSDTSLYSLSHIFTGAIGWNNREEQPLFGFIETHIDLIIEGEACLVAELNKPHPKKPTIYSPCYDNRTPAYQNHVDEIVIEGGHIIKILVASKGKTKIPKKGWIYALPEAYRNLTNFLKEGDCVVINITHSQRADPAPLFTNEEWLWRDHILASTPLLVYNDQIIPSLNDFTSTFYTKKHPRSAVGIRKDGTWVFVVVDGRQKHSEGFTILELAKFMKELGCSGALNLDGGGSSTMVIQGKTMNSPSGREYSLFRKERHISNALLICSKSC